MTEKGEKLLILAAGLFLALAVGVVTILYRMDESEFMAEGNNEADTEETIGGEYFEAAANEDADIVIPLPEGEGQFHIEEGEAGKKLTVKLDEVEEDFFARNKIRGNEEKISRIQLIKEQEATSLIFTFYHIYEADASLEEGEVHLRLISPMAGNEKIIVVDGLSEDFRKEVEQAFEPCEIKAVFNGDIKAANELRAECFVSMEQERTAVYGAGGYGTRGNTRRPQTEIVIYYNDDYFIPEFDSRSLAEIFQGYYNEFHDEWTVVLVKSDAFDLKDAMVPAVKIVYRVPYMTSEETAESESPEGESVESLTINALLLQFGGIEE